MPSVTTQSPMKLRFRCCHRWLRSSVLCGSLRVCQSFPYAADRASDSPAPSSFPSFICLQTPCSFFYGIFRLNKKGILAVSSLAHGIFVVSCVIFPCSTWTLLLWLQAPELRAPECLDSVLPVHARASLLCGIRDLNSLTRD